jgi:heptosyltransferase-2
MKVLIIRPAALGDTLMLVPAMAQLRRSAGIVLVGRSPGADYLRSYVDACMDYERGGWHNLFLDPSEKGRLPRIPPVNQLVAFLHDPEGLAIKNLRARFANIPVHRFAPFPPEGEEVHVAFYLAECLERAGCPLDAAACIEEACTRPLFGAMSAPPAGGNVVLHPGSGGAKKTSPAHFWLKLIEALKGLPPYHKERFSVLLGPAEEPLFTYYQEKLRLGETEILVSPEKERLCALLAGARLYVGHDSGITHLAAMHGTPTIALFKGTPVSQWRPLGPTVRMIEHKEAGPFVIKEVLQAAQELAVFVGKDQDSVVKSGDAL